MLLNCIGDESIGIFNTFQAEEKDTLKKLTDLHDAYFASRKNVVYNRYKSFTRVQQDHEPMDHYVTPIIILDAMCKHLKQLLLFFLRLLLQSGNHLKM